ncbi:MAG: hypothetical protein U0892_08450 [Pirellulales bacterium]
MIDVLKTRSGRLGFVAGTSAMLIVLGAGAMGYFLGSQRTANLNDLLLRNVSTAAAGSNMAVATGQISDEAEGVFFLDFTTGDLQCLVYYPRLGAFGARYYTNVQNQLPSGGRGSNYLLVTGNAIGNRGTSNVRAANCLVYVTDVTSGNFAAYVVPWNKTAESSAQAQGGPLLFAGGGPIRNYQVQNQNAGNNAGNNGQGNANNAANAPGNNLQNNGQNNNAQNNNAQNNMQAGANGGRLGGVVNGNALNGNALNGNAGAVNAAGQNMANPNNGNANGAQNNAAGNNPGLGNGGLGNGGLGIGGLGNGGIGGKPGAANDAGNKLPRGGDKKKGAPAKGKGDDGAD